MWNGITLTNPPCRWKKGSEEALVPGTMVMPTRIKNKNRNNEDDGGMMFGMFLRRVEFFECNSCLREFALMYYHLCLLFENDGWRIRLGGGRCIAGSAPLRSKERNHHDHRHKLVIDHYHQCELGPGATTRRGTMRRV